MKRATLLVLVLFATAIVISAYGVALAQQADQPRSQADIIASGTIVQTESGPVVRCPIGDIQLNNCDINKEDWGKNATFWGELKKGPKAGMWMMDVKKFEVNEY